MLFISQRVRHLTESLCHHEGESQQGVGCVFNDADSESVVAESKERGNLPELFVKCKSQKRDLAKTDDIIRTYDVLTTLKVYVTF
jgi:hypothetical protein